MCFSRLFFLCAVLLSHAAFAANSEPLRTAAEVLAASDDAYEQRRRFHLRGLITANGPKNYTLFHDNTGDIATTFDSKTGDRRPDAGSFVDIKGYLHINRSGNHNLYYTSCTVLSQGDPPPPAVLSFSQILAGEGCFKNVRTTGVIVEAYPDEVDASYSRIVLFANGLSLDAAVPKDTVGLEQLTGMIGATVRVTGICVRGEYWRLFAPPFFSNVSNIEILQSAPTDHFALPEIVSNRPKPSDRSLIGARMCAQGRVFAAWNHNQFVIRTDRGMHLRIHLNPSVSLPAFGKPVKVAGLVDTDSVNLILRNAIWTNGNSVVALDDKPTNVSIRSLFLDNKSLPAIQYDYDCQLVRLTGDVIAPQDGGDETRFLVCNDDFTLPIDASGCPDSIKGVAAGATVEITGACLVDFDSWRSNSPFPHVRGIRIAIRRPDDIRVLKRPSPITTGHLLFAIGALTVIVFVILVWNALLKHLVVRKSRELLRSQIAKAESDLRIDERTRLAAELHDNTVQNLTAIAYRITAAQGALNDQGSEAARILRVAAKMLKSCRTSLRQCLWDLRNDALNEPNFGTAVKRTVETVSGDAKLSVRFSGRRDLINDTTAHAVLNILRELVSNAAVHGAADTISIAGEARPGIIRFSVSDNGTGFDSAHRPGQDEGHFGIDGIQERLEALGGTMYIQSSPGRGTYVRITIQKT